MDTQCEVILEIVAKKYGHEVVGELGRFMRELVITILAPEDQSFFRACDFYRFGYIIGFVRASGDGHRDDDRNRYEIWDETL